MVVDWFLTGTARITKSWGEGKESQAVKLLRIGIESSVVAVLVLAIFLSAPRTVEAANCTQNTDYGSVSTSITVTEAGTYRLWSRLQNPSGTNGSYLFEINNSCINVGGIENTANTWTWVDYQNGNKNSKIDLNLAAGTYTVRMIGNQPNIKLDRVLLMPDALCVPADKGDSCVEAATQPGDVNGDKIVNVFDLSTLLSNWNKEGATKSQGDLNGDGVVNVFDLSTLLKNWGNSV